MLANISGNLAYKQNEKKYVKRKTNIKKKTIPTKEKLYYLFSVIFVVVLASIVISGYAQISELNYSIQKSENSIEQINNDNEDLQIKIAELSSPERIINIAQNELGMSFDEERLIVLANQ